MGERSYVENLVIVSHELFIIVFLMRLFRYPVHDYYEFDGLKNGQLIVLERPDDELLYDVTFTWAPGEEKAAGGLPRKPAGEAPKVEIWDGSATAPMLQSDDTAYVTLEGSTRKSVKK